MASLLPFSRKKAEKTVEERPVLHLSGPKLTTAMERLVAAAETAGGIEKLANAVKLKTALFQDMLGDGKAGELPLASFEQLCAFMPTCRRRLADPLASHGYDHFRRSLAALMEDGANADGADARMAAFQDTFPDDRTYRWVRDLGAEVLHFTWPEQFPLMTRWVWDARANTGVIREIWHGDNVDHMVIDIPDGHATFVMLREELSQFLADNGVFRDMLFYVDLLQAQIYADYINAQGGSYLRTDFASETDPLEHLRRILGLDGIDRRSGRTRFKTMDGSARAVPDTKLLS